MKKLLVMLMVFALVLSSCADNSQEQTTIKPAAPEESAAVETATVEAAPAVDTVTEAAEAYFSDFPGNRMVSTGDVMAAVDENADFLILDIRRPDVYAEGHLKGAVNAPWGPAIADSLEWLPADVPVYVNCYSGQTAGQAVAVLNIAGIEAYSIKYGWNLGISQTEGIDAYIETAENMSPEASGVAYDPAVKAAAAAYFNAIPEAGSNIIASAALNEKMTAGEELTIASIRQPGAYADGHIEGAINIPWGAGMQESFSQLPTDETFYVYCYSGQTAGQTVGVLRMLGYDAVSVKSGMGTGGTGGSGWANEGFPTVQ